MTDALSPSSRQVRGQLAPRAVAPMLVCNHVSLLDPLVLAILLVPSIVSTKEVFDWPLVGVMMRALQVGRAQRRAWLAGAFGLETGLTVSVSAWP